MQSFEEEYFEKRRNWYGKTINYSDVKHLVERKLSLAFNLFRKLHTSLRNSEGKEALVVGCGYGYECEILNKMGFSVRGLDISEYAVNLCKKRLAHLSFLVHDIYNTIPSSSDLIIGMEVLEHLYDPMKAIRNMYENLKVGGGIILTTPNKNSPYTLVNVVIDKTHINIKSQKEWFNLINSLNWSFIRIYSVQWIPWIWKPVKLPIIGNSLIIILLL